MKEHFGYLKWIKREPNILISSICKNTIMMYGICFLLFQMTNALIIIGCSFIGIISAILKSFFVYYQYENQYEPCLFIRRFKKYNKQFCSYSPENCSKCNKSSFRLLIKQSDIQNLESFDEISIVIECYDKGCIMFENKMKKEGIFQWVSIYDPEFDNFLM